ncbi:hypothetical protein DFJ73DRAFT_777473 [Zopfochytrium polystomum]|nr:hypothetical protein DFJ73DRAFT_777473 [Zopfochytrium polystomum]
MFVASLSTATAAAHILLQPNTVASLSSTGSSRGSVLFVFVIIVLVIVIGIIIIVVVVVVVQTASSSFGFLVFSELCSGASIAPGSGVRTISQIVVKRKVVPVIFFWQEAVLYMAYQKPETGLSAPPFDMGPGGPLHGSSQQTESADGMDEYDVWSTHMQRFARMIEEAEKAQGESYMSVSPSYSPLNPAIGIGSSARSSPGSPRVHGMSPLNSSGVGGGPAAPAGHGGLHHYPHHHHHHLTFKEHFHNPPPFPSPRLVAAGPPPWVFPAPLQTHGVNALNSAPPSSVPFMPFSPNGPNSAPPSGPPSASQTPSSLPINSSAGIPGATTASSAGLTPTSATAPLSASTTALVTPVSATFLSSGGAGQLCLPFSNSLSVSSSSLAPGATVAPPAPPPFSSFPSSGSLSSALSEKSSESNSATPTAASLQFPQTDAYASAALPTAMQQYSQGSSITPSQSLRPSHQAMSLDDLVQRQELLAQLYEADAARTGIGPSLSTSQQLAVPTPRLQQQQQLQLQPQQHQQQSLPLSQQFLFHQQDALASITTASQSLGQQNTASSAGTAMAMVTGDLPSSNVGSAQISMMGLMAPGRGGTDAPPLPLTLGRSDIDEDQELLLQMEMLAEMQRQQRAVIERMRVLRVAQQQQQQLLLQQQLLQGRMPPLNSGGVAGPASDQQSQQLDYKSLEQQHAAQQQYRHEQQQQEQLRLLQEQQQQQQHRGGGAGDAGGDESMDVG